MLSDWEFRDSGFGRSGTVQGFKASGRGVQGLGCLRLGGSV